MSSTGLKGTGGRRMMLSLPIETRRRMLEYQKTHDVNWSLVARRAFEDYMAAGAGRLTVEERLGDLRNKIMKLEPREFLLDHRTGETRRMLALIAESEMESRLIDEFLGSQIPTPVVGEIRLADGYGEHYILLENCQQAERLEYHGYETVEGHG